MRTIQRLHPILVFPTLTLLNAAHSAPVRLAVSGGSTGIPSSFDFGSARAGELVSHVFTLRNNTDHPLKIAKVQPTCACIGVILARAGDVDATIIQPGGEMRLSVRMDTGRVPASGAPTLTGSRTSQQVALYTSDQPSEPVAVLELRGRVTHGVAFDPPMVDFGRVDSVKGAVRTVKVSFEPGLYSPGRTRLVAPSGDPVTVTRLSGPHPSTLNRQHSTLTVSYRITVPPGSPASPLSGTLRVVGLATGTKGQPAAAEALAYVGQVTGPIRAEPGMVVFGLVRPVGAPGGPANDVEARQQRVRWVRLVGPAKLLALAAARSDGGAFRASIVRAPRPATAPAEAGPPPAGTWLRVELGQTAPRGSLTGRVTVDCGLARLRLPAMAQVE